MRGYPQTAVERADHPAVVHDRGTITYASSTSGPRGSRTCCAGLAACSPATGSRSCCRTRSSSSSAWRPGQAPCRRSPSIGTSSADEVAWILDDSDVRALVAHARPRAEVEGGRAATAPSRCSGSATTTTRPGRRARRVAALPVAHLLAGDLHLGHLGSPQGRGARHGGATRGHGDGARRAPGAVGLPADDVHLAAGPLYHAGPVGYCNLTLYVGGTVVIMDGWEARSFLRRRRDAPGHHHVPHARPLHPHPRGAGGRAGRATT